MRFIEMDGIDASTCCGTHVSMLGEIGIIKIIGWEKYKQNIRLQLTGKRAVAYFSKSILCCNEVSKKLNISPVFSKGLISLLFIKGINNKEGLPKKLYEKEIHREANELVANGLNGIVEAIGKIDHCRR
ncbi:hypothetical protein KHA80_18935 [Anaerobacillus sp. HL2]|nr:hypothetical protein KHA80_18935 [Anaerobacillus sp. HL2]